MSSFIDNGNRWKPPPVPDVIPELVPLLTWLDQLEDSLQPLRQDTKAYATAAVSDVVQAWSKDKKYYSHVKELMSQIMAEADQPDLDAVYQKAIFSHPEIKAFAEADKAQAEREAQEKQELLTALDRSEEHDDARRKSFDRWTPNERSPVPQGQEAQTSTNSLDQA